MIYRIFRIIPIDSNMFYLWDSRMEKKPPVWDSHKFHIKIFA